MGNGQLKDQKPASTMSRMKPRPQPATEIKNDRIRRIIESNSQVPLFRSLPREIQDEIWGYVFLVRMIRIRSDHRDGKPEKRPRTIVYGPGNDRFLNNIEGTKFQWQGWWPQRNKTMDSLLTCRKFYLQATEFFYERMIFSFADLMSFQSFMTTRNEFQKRTMRNLRLAGCMYPLPRECYRLEWQSFATIISELKGLKTLILHREHFDRNPHPYYFWGSMAVYGRRQRLDDIKKTPALRIFQMHHLERVIFSSVLFHNGAGSGGIPYQETGGEKLLRQIILDPDREAKQKMREQVEITTKEMAQEMAAQVQQKTKVRTIFYSTRTDSQASDHTVEHRNSQGHKDTWSEFEIVSYLVSVSFTIILIWAILLYDEFWP